MDTLELRRQIRQEMEAALPLLQNGPPKNLSAFSFDSSLDHHLGRLQSLCSTAANKVDLGDYILSPVWYWFRKAYWVGGSCAKNGGFDSWDTKHIEVAPSLKVLQAYRHYAYSHTPGPSMKGLALVNKKRPIAIMLQPQRHFGKSVQVVHEKLRPVGC